MELPKNIRTLLDHQLDANETFRVKTFKWLPGYIVKRGIERITNAEIMRNKIEKLGLKRIRIPKKYHYKDDIIVCEYIAGHTWFQSQEFVDTETMTELHDLIVEGHTKYYEMITRNWIISGRYLYIIDLDNKSIPSSLERRIFYETSWFLLGDIITDHGGCFMNMKVNHPFQIIVRGCMSEHSTYTNDVSALISKLFKNDKQERQMQYDKYMNKACRIHSCKRPEMPISDEHYKFIQYDVDNPTIQLATALYLADLHQEFRTALMTNPHLLKDVINEVRYRGYDESNQSPVPPIKAYEFDSLETILASELD